MKNINKTTSYFLVTVFWLAVLTFWSVKTQAQTIVSTTPENKNAILEEFTGIYCVYCPDGHLIANNLKYAYPNDLFLLNLHTGGYANPGQSGDPDFRVLENDSIADLSSLAGYPAGTVNRYQFPMTQGGGTAMSRGDWADAVQDIITQPSYLNVGVLAEHDTLNDYINITAEVYYTDSLEIDGFGFQSINYLNIVLTQDSVLGPQTGGSQYNPGAIVNGPWQPTYSHQHMVREYITGQWGVQLNSMNALVYPGDLFTNTFTYYIPNNINDIIFDINNIKVTAYVTENPFGEIVTGTGCNITLPTPPPVSVVDILSKSNTYNKIYDILGRELSEIPTGTMYIRNQKLYINK